MASIVTDPNGRKRVSFKFQGKRRTLRLGPVSDEIAGDHKTIVEQFVACQHAPERMPEKTVRVVAVMPDEIYDRYASCGLVPDRQPAETVLVDKLLEDFSAEVAHRKPSTKSFYASVLADLRGGFAGRSVGSVSPKAADDFVVLMRKKLGAATIARRIKAYRMIFARACRWGWIHENPFTGIRAGSSVNRGRQHYIPMEHFEKLIDATPDRELRALLALSRIGALRCPSEIHPLRWIDVHWDDGELFVRSSKTEEHEGGESRLVPLFPRLRDLLQDWFEHAPDGAVYVVPAARDGTKNFRTRLGRLIDRVGLARWPRMFHNMRASRESELVQEYPLVDVCRWIGNSPEVAAKHYLMDPTNDANFRAAAGLTLTDPTRNSTRASGEKAGRGGKPIVRNGENAADSSVSGWGGRLGKCARRDSKAAGFPSDSGGENTADALSDARSPELINLIENWGRLPASVRAQILDLANAKERA